MLSPVCMPRGSKFSMLHTVMQLSLLSRTTSYSTSFQPFSDLSINTWSECANASWTSLSSAFSSAAKPDPRPPSAKAARTSTGYPSRFAATTDSSIELAAKDSAHLSPIFLSSCAKTSLSSVLMIAAMGVPRTLQPYFLKTPFLSSCTAQLRAVCPPKVQRMPSGRSFLMTSSTNWGVTGRKYTRSASPLDVCTVAIFGLISTE
mmetsp:Transcript_15667/g.37383  ORF Transcript_15667/g.37383 Transcript_15667/m.37383 type:complete len:204 (+) Transcript_15667:1277-1888(+)